MAKLNEVGADRVGEFVTVPLRFGVTHKQVGQAIEQRVLVILARPFAPDLGPMIVRQLIRKLLYVG
jgi:hypothetical protein